MPAFQGAAIQRGRGLGGVLGGFLRNIILPTGKTVGKSLLRIRAPKAAGVLSDVARGAPIQAAFMKQMNPCPTSRGVMRNMTAGKPRATKRRATRRMTQDIFAI